MVPAASVLIPTRGRRAYLAVALAALAPQLRAHGAELVVVEDDAVDPETVALVCAHGGAHVALGAPHGINVARNAAVEVAAAPLLCFLDDDSEPWPGWLAALLAAAAAHPGHEAFGGPIRGRLEGGRLHPCGREPLPVTTLDLGLEDRDAELAWGANLAVRRSALERIGPFDPGLNGAGDEEDWLRRLRAAGGRIRYVAAAGVDHRRAGADATVPALARAAYHRGRFARRWNVRKGSAPPLARELRTLAGCVWHTGRRRCGTGIVLTAQTAGRLREALAPVPAPPSAAEPDYLSGHSGTLSRRGRALGHARDVAADALTLPARAALRRAAARTPPRRTVLVAGVARPEHATIAHGLERELRRTRHDVALHLEPPRPGLGKWANLDEMLRAHPPAGADWLLLVDDDVLLPWGFLDVFLHVCEARGLKLAQPAHAFASHAAWAVTRRRPGLVAHRTRFVEIGPVTALHRDTFAALLPFPALAMGWGLDAHWSALAAANGWPLGVVDATPIRHVRPVAASYGREAALAEAAAFLRDRPYVTREEAAEVLAAWGRDRWPAHVVGPGVNARAGRGPFTRAAGAVASRARGRPGAPPSTGAARTTAPPA